DPARHEDRHAERARFRRPSWSRSPGPSLAQARQVAKPWPIWVDNCYWPRGAHRRQMMAIPFSVPSLALPGKVAIITGGGTGMGRSMAVEFAKAGADVVGASRTGANLERVAVDVRAPGRRSLAVKTDVSQKADVDRMVATTMETFGQVDILVNNAGVGSGIGEGGRGLGHRDPPWLIDIPEDNWDPIIAVNLKGVYL